MPGLVRLKFEHFPLQSHAPMAQQAAAASECAVEQGAFWTYHDRLFPAQDQAQAGFTPEALIRYAGELGMNEAAFRQCVTSQKHVGAVTTSFNRAISMGLNATPSLLVNGVPVADPFDYDALTARIDGLLEAQ
jgi:protein-disulfide isomerase